MPPIFRHVVPNVPAWTAGNGKPCYRGNAPSCQAEMQIASLVWAGDVDVSSLGEARQTITEAEMNTAMSAFLPYAQTHQGNAMFYYGHAVSNVNDFAVWGRVWASTWVSVASDVRMGNFIMDFGLYWSAAESFWKWRAEIHSLNFFRVSHHPFASHPARFESSAQTQNIRLGAGQTMSYVGQFPPNYFASAFNGCSLTIGAQYA